MEVLETLNDPPPIHKRKINEARININQKKINILMNQRAGNKVRSLSHFETWNHPGVSSFKVRHRAWEPQKATKIQTLHLKLCTEL